MAQPALAMLLVPFAFVGLKRNSQVAVSFARIGFTYDASVQLGQIFKRAIKGPETCAKGHGGSDHILPTVDGRLANLIAP